MTMRGLSKQAAFWSLCLGSVLHVVSSFNLLLYLVCVVNGRIRVLTTELLLTLCLSVCVGLSEDECV